MTAAEWLYTVDDGIGRYVFNRPEARNALTYPMYEELARVCAEMPTDGAVKALIVTGSGGSFAAGTDMALFRDFTTAEQAWAYEDRMERVFDAIERCPVPTIAAIDGACTGGGAAIAACCDLRIATRRIRFGFPIARTLGNALSAANLRRLVALVGAARTREAILTAKLFDDEASLAAGFVHELVADAAALDARSCELATTLAGHAPLTMRATKEALRRLLHSEPVDARDLVALCYTSADFKEGMDAFLAKRRPVWQGR